MIGKVKWFNAQKGFGFINHENDEKDIFVHYSQIQDTGYRTLNEGEKVEFDLKKHNHALCIIDSGADHADLTDE